MKKILGVLLIIMLIFVVAGCNGSDQTGNSGETDAVTQAENTVDSSSDGSVDNDVDTSEEAVFEVGKPAPPFSLEGLDGETISLDDYKGKYVMINFWATWCGFCEEEMPDLQTFAATNDDLVIIAVNVGEKRDIVEKYVSENNLELKVALDPDSNLAKTYYISNFPTSIFIDRSGKLIGGVQGMMTLENMEQVFDFVKEEEKKYE